MTICDDAVGLFMLEGICQDLRAKAEARRPPQKPAKPAGSVVVRIATRAKMMISLLCGVCLSLSTV
ncbi:hypothetical protein [Planctomicrobium piriforme]|uniref:Uncharacterized protein n=1 Tax=Planctomicrobium piriforme TaxID=1576369 RepID=A0A1I3MTF4_9PLAN|nr:hypothetical protein [Planctomicrobium piriforme]SFJ00298.1 hypothetical protein SAMN05421753_114105 [Planctomicrobium piriforme]